MTNYNINTQHSRWRSAIAGGLVTLASLGLPGCTTSMVYKEIDFEHRIGLISEATASKQKEDVRRSNLERGLWYKPTSKKLLLLVGTIGHYCK